MTRDMVPSALRALPLLLVLVVGCGGTDEKQSGARTGAAGNSAPAELPYPPRAAEPAASPPVDAPPAGRVVRVGGPAEGVVVDPGTGLLALARRDRPELTIVHARSGQVRERVRLPARARHLALSKPGGHVLVPAEEADVLARVSLPGGRTRTTRVGDFPHSAAFSDGRAYTVDEFGSTVTAIENGKRVAQALVDVQPGGIVAVRDQLAVISVRAYTLTLLDQRTLRSGSSQFAGSGPTHGVADGHDRIYVTDTRGNALSVFSTRPRLKFIARVPLPGGAPLGIAADARRNRIWVTLTATNELVEIEAGERPQRRRTFPTVRQPNSVAVDERTGRVAVPSAVDDALQFIDP